MVMVSQTSLACAEPKLSERDEINENDGRRAEQVQRAQWLRAAILGANDGLLSTTSLILGVGAAKEDRRTMIVSGLAGAFAGACSMAVGEFVSVSTQRDIERATMANSSRTSKLFGNLDPGVELHITVSAASNITETKRVETAMTCESTVEKMSPAMARGRKLAPDFSPGRSPMMKVIQENARTTNTTTVETEDDKGEEALPNPYKAAGASALAFLCGSLVPLVSALCFVNNTIRIAVIVVAASVAMALFGGMGAYLGGSPIRVSAGRVLVGGWITMAITYGILKSFDRDH